MAAYSFLSKQDLQHVCEKFGFSQIIAATPIAEGVENSNYLLQVLDGKGLPQKFILTIFENRVNEIDLPFFLQLKQHLRSQSYNCPSPIKNLHGELYFHLQNKCATIVSFLQGKSIEPPKSAHIAQAGEWLAQLHRLAKNFPIERVNNMGYAQWKILRDKIALKAQQKLHLDWLALMNDELKFQANISHAALPSGVIHGDFFPNNVFFDEAEKLCGVIDFYFACNDLLAYDIAIVANAWCCDDDGRLRIDDYAILLDSYNNIRAIETAEREALPNLLRAAALRFLATRLYDLLHTPDDAYVTPHNPNEYVQKLLYFRDNKF